MIQISTTRFRSFIKFLIIAGVGALWLSFWWYRVNFGSTPFDIGSNFSSFSILYYYLCNSLLLLFSAIALSKKRFLLHSLLAIVLGLSVLASMFIFDSGSTQFLLNNLFLYTTYSGVLMGVLYGGTILIPIFFLAVYKNFMYGAFYILGKLNYLEIGESDASIEGEKELFTENIPLVGILSAILHISLVLNFKLVLNGDAIAVLTSVVPILIVLFSVFSLLNKHFHTYRIINSIIVGLMLLPFVLIIANKII